MRNIFSFGTILFLSVFVLVASVTFGGIAGENFNGRVVSFVPVTGLWETEKLAKGYTYCLRRAGVENPERVEKGLKPLLNENAGEFLKILMKNPEYSISLFKKIDRYLDGTISVNAFCGENKKQVICGIAFDIKKNSDHLIFGIDRASSEAVLLRIREGKNYRVSSRSIKINQNWNKIEVVTASKDVKCYVNGKMVLHFRNEYYIDGMLGLGVLGDGKVYFDDFLVNYDEYNRYGGGCGCY